MKRTTLILLALGLAAPAPRAHAQSCSVNGAGVCAVSGGLNVSITIGRAIQLTLSSATTILTAPTPAHFNAGFAQSVGPSLTVFANGPYTLTVAAAASPWNAVDTGSETARTDKPASDLEWATAAAGTYSALSTTPVTLISGAAAPAGTSLDLFFRTRYAWNLDTPGSYSIQLAFTLIAP